MVDGISRYQQGVNWPVDTSSSSTATSPEDVAAKQARQRVIFAKRYMDTQQSLQIGQSAGKVDLDAKTKAPTRPKLEPPLPHSNPNSRELAGELNTFLKNFFNAMQAQKGFRETHRGLLMDMIQMNQKLERDLQKEKFNLQTHIQETNEKSKTAANVDIGLTIGLAVAFVGSILATIFTAGAALPLVLAGVQGGIAIAQGANSIAKGRFDAEIKETETKLFGVREQTSATHQLITEAVTQTKHETSQTVNYDKWQRESMENLNKAIQQIFN